MADPTLDAPPAIGEFAQTRGDDDLFDDEIIPVSTEEQTQPEVQPQEEAVEVEKPVNEGPPASTPTRPRSHGGERGGGRGRGKGRGRGGRGARNSSGPGRAEGGGKNKPAENAPEAEGASVEEPTQERPEKGTQPPEEDAAEAEGPRVPAVRGDRSATGGIKKPKLTEEQLSQRIAAAKENAAKLSAAHARAEADHASFLEREKVADVKRRQERQSRRVMDMEREKNRQRKLGALDGREWDATKHEEDYNPRSGKSQFRRGMHGGVSGYARRDFEDGRQGEDAPNNQGHHNSNRGRGRGGRGGRGGPRRDPTTASSGPATKETNNTPPAPVVKSESDFPALPSNSKDTPAEPKPIPEAKKPELAMSPVAAGATWADQVEAE